MGIDKIFPIPIPFSILLIGFGSFVDSLIRFSFGKKKAITM